MAEPMSGLVNRCPWCSAALPDPEPDTCPACKAALVTVPGVEGEIKGVTALDPEAILRARSELSRPRGNRLVSLLTGEIPVDTSTPADPDVFARPPDEVRREMLRMQLEAARADATAEAVALKADELARLGIHVSELGGEEVLAAPAPEPADADADPAEGTTPAGDADSEAAPPVPAWPEELTPDEDRPAG